MAPEVLGHQRYTEKADVYRSAPVMVTQSVLSCGLNGISPLRASYASPVGTSSHCQNPAAVTDDGAHSCSFGIVLWECAARALPYAGLNGMQVCAVSLSTVCWAAWCF